MRFMALRDFYCEELGSQYVAGLTYAVRPILSYSERTGATFTISAQDTVLAKLVPKWLAENPPPIRLLMDDGAVPTIGMGSVKGRGTVRDGRKSTKG